MIKKLVICLNYGHFEKKLRSVIVSQNHYLNQILDVHPLAYIALSDPGSMKFCHNIEQSTTIERQLCVKMWLWQFFKHKIYVTICEKLSESHFDVSLFSNPGDSVWKARKTMGQICTTLFLHLMTLSPRLENNNALQCSSDSLPCMVIYILCVENCWNYILTHSCLHSKVFSTIWLNFFMKNGDVWPCFIVHWWLIGESWGFLRQSQGFGGMANIFQTFLSFFTY